MTMESAFLALVRQAVAEALADQQARSIAPASSPPPAEYLTFDDAAAYASVSKGTIRNWVKAGRIGSYGVGRVARVKRAELDALLSQGGLREDLPSASEQADAIIMRIAKKAANGSRG